MADSQVTLQALFSINGVPTLIDLYAVTDGVGNYALESQPRTNGQPVSTAYPMPVIDPAAITQLTAIAASVASGATSALQATGNTTLAAILTDVAATAAGGATAALQSAGNASLATTATQTTATATALAGYLNTAPTIGNAVTPFAATTADQAISGLTLPGKFRITYPAYQIGTTTPNTGQIQINYAGGNSLTAPTGAMLPGAVDDWIHIAGSTAPHVSITTGTATILIQQ